MFLHLFYNNCFFSCSIDGKFQPSKATAEKDKIISSYQNIGLEHNSILANYYNEVTQATQQGESEAEIFYNFFGNTEDSIRFELTGTLSNGRSVMGTDTLVEVMVANDLVSTSSAEYILKVESIINNPTDDIDDMLARIVTIQYEALDTLTGTSLDEFMAYAETAKSSLNFWALNIEELMNSEIPIVIIPNTNNNQRNIFDDIKKAWNKYKNQIAMAAASDAAGAAAGAAFGAAIGSSIPGVGTAAGAAVGAVVAGAASSEEGFRTGKLCIIIPLTKIERDINNKK